LIDRTERQKGRHTDRTTEHSDRGTKETTDRMANRG
jgi:hypothetical protein